MEGPPLGPGGEDITWPDQVAPRGRKASSTRKIKPQTSNLMGLGCGSLVWLLLSMRKLQGVVDVRVLLLLMRTLRGLLDVRFFLGTPRWT